MATVRSRVLATLALSFALAACSGSPVFALTNTLVPLAARTLLETDLSTASTGWVPVACGDAQASVPASFIVVYPGQILFCGSVRSVETLFLEPTLTTRTGPGCPAEIRSTLVRLASTRQVPAKYASEKPVILNGVPVCFGPTDELLARYTYYAPSLGVEATADGLLARLVIGTLARSPRATALALGTAPSVPASWRSVAFSGLGFSVPAEWTVERTETWNLCGPVQIAIGQGVTLDTEKVFLALPCPAPLSFPVTPSDGVRIDSGAQGPTGPFPAGGACIHAAGLTTCPSSAPDHSILLLRVTVPGRATPVFVSIGLAGSGMVARTILCSPRAG